MRLKEWPLQALAGYFWVSGGSLGETIGSTSLGHSGIAAETIGSTSLGHSGIAAETIEVLNRPGLGWTGCKRVYLTRQASYLQRQPHEQIHLYTSSAIVEVFGPDWYGVMDGKDVEKRWHFWPEDLSAAVAAPRAAALLPPAAAPPPAPPPQAKIPPHVFRAYVEAAIGSGTECPITMSPLTQTTAAAPPCGHLFEHEALRKALADSGRCPTCRCAARPEEIQTLTS